MTRVLNRAKIATLVITKASTASRIAWGAFLGSTKIKMARLRVNSALKTRRQPIANVPHHVMYVVRAGRHQTEVCHVQNVWPGNLKKPRTRTKRFVPFVHRATTRTRQTCLRASSARVGTLNLPQNKRRVLNAAPVNSTMLQGQVIANHA